MEGGRIQFSGQASQLRENPELLQSAYLLRGLNGSAASAVSAGSAGGPAPASAAPPSS
jgi:hypothetical protein